VAVSRCQQHLIQQPGQSLVTIAADPHGACRVNQHQGYREFPGQLEEIVERVLRGRQDRRPVIVSGEAGGDLVRIHLVLARALPRGEHLGADDIPRDRARPAGQEGPPGRFDIDRPGHADRLRRPRPAGPSHREPRLAPRSPRGGFGVSADNDPGDVEVRAAAPTLG
jgi:hypothetical protein